MGGGGGGAAAGEVVSGLFEAVPELFEAGGLAEGFSPFALLVFRLSEARRGGRLDDPASGSRSTDGCAAASESAEGWSLVGSSVSTTDAPTPASCSFGADLPPAAAGWTSDSSGEGGTGADTISTVGAAVAGAARGRNPPSAAYPPMVAPATTIGACDGDGTNATTLVLSSSYDARVLTQSVTFQLAPGQRPPAAACVRLTQPAGARSFVDDAVASSRFVALRRRAHRLKALVDDEITRPTPETMPLAVAANTARTNWLLLASLLPHT